MEKYEVFFFGQFYLQHAGEGWRKAIHSKAWQIFWYLSSHRQRVQTRDTLAGLFWGGVPNDHAKKQLRQALWRLHAETRLSPQFAETRLVVVEAEQVYLNPALEWWIDLEDFDRAFSLVRQARCLNADLATALRRAIALYRGEFLEGCYDDWCLYERERLQNQYLFMLDKLADYCLSEGAYEEGFACGEKVLAINPCAERTYRQMMKLHYLMGNRPAALRQYQQCQKVLREELGVSPSAASQALYTQLCSDQLPPAGALPAPEHGPAPPSLQNVLNRLKQAQTTLTILQEQIQQDIHLVEELFLCQH